MKLLIELSIRVIAGTLFGFTIADSIVPPHIFTLPVDISLLIVSVVIFILSATVDHYE